MLNYITALLLFCCSCLYAEEIIILDQTVDLRRFRSIDRSEPGLEGFKFSGSAQFSEAGLEELKEKLDQKDLIIVDLRRESHGFINGLPISWINPDDSWTNQGLDAAEIQNAEKLLLRQAQNMNYIIINKVLKDNGKRSFIPMPTTVTRTITESNLCARDGIGYVRIPVDDHKAPGIKNVDAFILLYTTRPKDSWVHIHCRGGMGRTSTFLIMADMLHNAKTLSFDDIMKRENAINHTNLLTPLSSLALLYKEEFIGRLNFLKTFYKYCKENTDDFATSWSTWLKVTKTKLNPLPKP